MPLIDRETVQRITDAADIVEVVGDYVHLVRRGANYMGLCPFHNERTPSFSVNKRKNFCYCFSCKQGGSPVNFIMKKEGLSYHEALLHLAKKYGIEVRQRELTPEEKLRQTEREAMLVANEWAMQQMMDNLHNTEEGQAIGLSYFFGQREITKEACDAFRLGYAIDKGNALVSEAQKKGFDINILKKVGLVGESQEGRIYDKYRGRVIFPILNTSGKVIGFGGRTLKNDKAKYINSPESEIYKKGNELYGIYQARNTITREDKCYLVEGYFDVIGMWQSGMKNVVASSGTALTDDQINLIHRFTDNITLIYDGDGAGIKAAFRGMDMLLHHKMNVKVLLLPDGDDPDSFARKHTPQEFVEYVKANETDVITFKAQVLMANNAGDTQSRISAIHDMVTTLAHIEDPISLDEYVKTTVQIMSAREELIREEVAKKRRELVENWRKRPSNLPEHKPNPIDPDSTSNAIEPTATTSSESGASRKMPAPLYPLEKRILEFVVKYGYLPFCPADEYEEEMNESDNPSAEDRSNWLNIVEFISSELHEDSINLSEPIFSKIIDLLIESKPMFLNAKSKKEEDLRIECDQLRKKGYEEIAARDLSMSEIEREEKFLEKKLEDFQKGELFDFVKNYPARLLSSYEDDDVRETAIELAVEHHQLSNIYFRDGNVVETEEDKLDMLVPRAVDELKSEILSLQLKDLYKKLQETDDSEMQVMILKEINDKIHIRAILAKNLGERIISPLNGRKDL